jgi:hypothetical protein
MLGLKRPSDVPPMVIAIVGFAFAAVLALRLLIPNGMDPSVFVAFGEESPIQTPYGIRMLGHLSTRPGGGHDGQSFFIQANDPWYLQPRENAALLDRPLYRAQRMLFPMIVGGFGFFRPWTIVWAMLIVNLLGLAIGTFVAAKLARLLGGPAWLGLWVPLNVGLLFELDIGGSGILAYVCCLCAVYSLERERSWSAALLFAAGTLSRETMLAFAAGVCVLWFVERRRLIWRLVVVPFAALVVWDAYVWFRLHDVAGVGGGTGNFGPPLVGLLEAVGSWVDEPLDLIISLVIVAVTVALVPNAVRSRSPIAWGALPFAALAAVLSANVWREPFNSSRALVPIFTALPFLIILRDRRPLESSTRPIREPM